MIAGKESSFGSLQLRASLPRPTQPSRLARSPRNLCIALYPHFERSYLVSSFPLQQSRFLSTFNRAWSSRVASSSHPRRSPQNVLRTLRPKSTRSSQWTATPFQVCSAITKSDCGRGCERGRLGLGLQREECDNPTPIGGQDTRWKRP